MGKSKKRAHSKEKENRELWKRLRNLEHMIESRLPARQSLEERWYDNNETLNLAENASNTSQITNLGKFESQSEQKH